MITFDRRTITESLAAAWSAAEDGGTEAEILEALKPALEILRQSRAEREKLQRRRAEGRVRA